MSEREQLRVMVVENERSMLELLQDFFQMQEGMVCCAAASTGREALDLVYSTLPDVLLLDLVMPGMDGLKATRILREYARFDNLPIIAMTAHAMNGDREKSLSVGMQDYIAKPIEPSVLLSTLARWIHRDGRSPRR